MRMMRSLMAASAVVAAGLSAAAAQAAPLGGGAGAAAAPSVERSALVQEAAYRRCWIAGGVRHCRWFADPYDDGYGYYDDYYEPGTATVRA
jgi:hypothetical protein